MTRTSDFFRQDCLAISATEWIPAIELIPNRFSLSTLPYIYRKPALSGLFDRISKPLARLSEFSPGLFSTRLFARAVKG